METEQSSILCNLTWKYVNKNFQIDRVHQWMQFRFVPLLIFFLSNFFCLVQFFAYSFLFDAIPQRYCFVFYPLIHSQFHRQNHSHFGKQLSFTFFHHVLPLNAVLWIFGGCVSKWDSDGSLKQLLYHFNQMEWWHVTECNWYTMIDGSILEIWLSKK